MPIISSRVVNALGVGVASVPVAVRLMWASGYITPERRLGIMSWSTVTAADGTWQINLPTNAAGQVYQIEVNGVYREVTLGAVAVQLPWLQSTSNTTAPVDPYVPFSTAAAAGAIGDGVNDDTIPLQTALSASVGKRLMLAPGTYLISSTLTCSVAGAVIEGSGAVIKKAATMTGNALNVTGANVTLRDVIIDGNRSGGATGGNIFWTGANGLCERVTSKASAAQGLVVQGAITVTVRDTSLTDHQNAFKTGDGLFVWIGARVIVENLYAADCDRAGIYIVKTGTTYAADQQVILSALVERCMWGVRIDGTNFGTIGTLTIRDVTNFGLALYHHASSWAVGHVDVHNAGAAVASIGAAVNNAGTAIELYGSRYCHFGSIAVWNARGYGLALTYDTTDNTWKAIHNSFGVVRVVMNAGVDSDPAVHLSQNATNNCFDAIHVQNATIALILGEGSSGNDHNMVGTLYSSECGYMAVKIDGGSNNNIGRMVVRGQRNAEPALVGQGVIHLSGTTVGNRFGYLEYQNNPGFAYSPTCLIYATATAASNVLESGVSSSGIPTLTDLNGTNRADIDDGWVAMTGMTNSWVNYGAPFQTARYKRNPHRLVMLSGTVKDGTVAAGATGVIFTLPVGFRPPADVQFPTVAGGVLGRINVETSGAVKCTFGTNTYVSLDSVQFEAA